MLNSRALRPIQDTPSIPRSMQSIGERIDCVRKALDEEIAKVDERIAFEAKAVKAGRDDVRLVELELTMIELRLLSSSIDGLYTMAEDRVLAIQGQLVELRLRIGGNRSGASMSE